MARPSLRVMTYNILHDAVRNLSGSWIARRPLVAATIRSADPDVALLQEVSPRQLEHLTSDLPEYELLEGESSEGTRFPRWAAPLEGTAWHILGDFISRGEQCPILIRKGRVSCIEHDTFWVSPRHKESWTEWLRSPSPHIVTWARIETKSGVACAVYSTHLGILPWSAARTAKALLAALDRDWREEPQILAGDFNSLRGWPLLRALLVNGTAGPPAFHDAWPEALIRVGTGTTFHWGFGWRGPRLDYMLVRPQPTIVRAETVGYRTGGIFPSDHLALVVDLEL